MDDTEQYPPSERLQQPLTVPQRLLMGPGPSNSSPRVLQAAALPLLGHLHPEFLDVMDDIQAGIRYAFQTSNPFALAVSGTGHAGMEAALVNLIEPGDTVLILKTGIWGERAKDMAERLCTTIFVLEHPPGKVFSLEEITTAIVTHKPAVLFVTHGESSDGTCQPLEGIGEVCRKYDCLLLVDTVASLGSTPFYMDKWLVDAVYTGSQKVLSVTPGTAPICFGERARLKMTSRKTKVQSFYFDMNLLASYWGIEGRPRSYHHTGPISSFYALREGLAMLSEEGLENCWRRHRKNSQLLWEGLKKLGLELFVEEEAHRLRTVTTIVVPLGVDWKAVTTYIMKKHGIEISGGLGPSAGKVWRIGLMGYNSTAENVSAVLSALEDALQHSGNQLKSQQPEQ